MSNRCMSLPDELKAEWIDPRPPESVPRREKVKWLIAGVETELTKEVRIARWRRKQPKSGGPSQAGAVPSPALQVAADSPKPESQLLAAARKANLLGGRIGTDTFMVLCPWRQQHIVGSQQQGQHDQSTQINATDGTFTCRHKACKGKSATEFMAELGAPTNETEVILVVDDSGSISHSGNIATVKNQYETIITQIKNDNPHWHVRLVFFGEKQFVKADAQAKDISIQSIYYYPRQNETRLYNAMYDAADCALKAKVPALVYLITDGEPNGPQQNPVAAAAKVKEALATDRVTFVCVGPARATSFFTSCAIPSDCIRSWDGVNTEDLNRVTTQVSSGLTDYATARSAGQTQVKKFFVDARKLNDQLGSLVDISQLCKVLPVTREAVLQPFVEEYGLKFIIGANYYELTKAETLRPNRAILVRQKGTKRILSGPNVRQVLGLPNDRDIKVEPGDMGNLDLFLESTSHNRMLVRGTDVVVRLDHQGSEHTWAKPQA